MTNKIQTVKIKDTDTVEVLSDLMNDIAKIMPDISFKPYNINTWGIVKDDYPNGVCDGVYAFHSSDLNNHIGILEVSNYYNNSESHKPKYGITSINIDDGRHTYGGEGAYKYSIHSKNIVRIAKKVFKPFTFDQIADRAKRKFRQEIDSIGNRATWDMRNNTCSDIDIFQNDLIALRKECGVDHLIPGLTGWAQINGRDDLPVSEKVKLDVEYLSRKSLWFDLKIIWLTALKVISRDGVSH
jgi:hypothetical protein